METAIVIFAYNRDWHLSCTLEGLKKNRNVQEIYIFQDGLKCEEHREGWEKTRKVIEDIDWCEVRYILSPYNKGLSRSIVNGVNMVLEEKDAVIVLEDDCVPMPGFMTFMTESLQKYQDKQQVYSVSGYAEPIEVSDNGTDGYFTGRASSWGWGTWKDRWQQYDWDYTMLGRIKKDRELAEVLEAWGGDLETYLLGNIYGHCDSWAAFWALKVIEKRGFCLAPYKSLIENIGFDGTGVHCGSEGFHQAVESKKCKFKYPDNIEFPPDYKTICKDVYSIASPEKRLSAYNEVLMRWIAEAMAGRSITDFLKDRGITKLSIWGKGKICDLLLAQLEGHIEVLSIIESIPIQKCYHGIPVVSVEEIPEKTEVVLVIPVYDFVKIQRLAKQKTNLELIPLDALFKKEEV